MIKTKCKKNNRKRISEIEKPEYEGNSLCQFMNSAMNIEFVYLILVGINNFMENFGQDDEKSHSEILTTRGRDEQETKKISMSKDA